jgi:hypothetical protein
MNNPKWRVFSYTAAIALLTSLPLHGKEKKGLHPDASSTRETPPTSEPRVLERMLLAVQESAFYTQRQCEVYLAVADFLFPEMNVPSVQDWMKARTYFRNDMLIWEEVRNTPFYRVSSISIETKWRQIAPAHSNGAIVKTLRHFQVQDAELRRILEEVLIIQNAKSMKSKLNPIETWISTLEKKFHSRFFDNTDTYIPLEPLAEKAITP